jgi:WD40 repeat protein/HEAT repeat protein
MSRRYGNTRKKREQNLQYWQQIVENRLPVVGAWFREVAANRLAQEARSGNRPALHSLARALDGSSDEHVQQIAGEVIRGIESGGQLNTAWEVWLERRGPRLEALLVEKNQVSTVSAGSLRVYSALRLGKGHLLADMDAQSVPALLAACEDRDSILCSTAREVVSQLTDPQGILAVCAAWAEQRKPWLDEIVARASFFPESEPLRVMVCLRRGLAERLLPGSAESVEPLVHLLADRDPEIRRQAEFCLRHLDTPAAIDRFCQVWADQRLPLLETILLQRGYLARQPVRARLLSALKLGRLELAQQVSAANVHRLLDIARDDPDAEIRERAEQALTHLSQEDTRQQVCRIFIEQGHPAARKVAMQAGYRPSDPAQRALFLFLAWQWDEYAEIDFDGRLMRSVFCAAQPDLRKRIAASVRYSGRIDFLAILTNPEPSGPAGRLTPDETQVMVRLLLAEQQWGRLWDLAWQVPLTPSLDILKRLPADGWQSDECDAPLFAELKARLRSPAISNPPDVARLVPLAVASAVVRVHGRENDIAFSPGAPLLAMGTGSRKVVLWNYQTGSVERVIHGFAHSVGRVAYLKSGRLIASERANPDTPCSIYDLTGEQPVVIGQHAGSIDSLEPAGEERFVTCGSDRRVVVWDAALCRSLTEITLPTEYERTRALVVEPRGNHLALLHHSVGFLSLPGLENYQGVHRVGNGPNIRKSVPRCGAFVEPSGDVVVGQFNGQVVWYKAQSQAAYWRKLLLAEHDKPAHGVSFLARRKLLISGGGEGRLQLIGWPEQTPRVSLTAPCDGLTSLEISADEAFLATGHRDSTFVLWDLRMGDLPALFDQPICELRPADLAVIRSLVSASGRLPAHLQNALGCLQAMLEHRLRFDIQVEDLPVLRPGEFDILLADG